MKKFLAGALLGAGVALLYAPATGRRTRAILRDKATKMGHEISEFTESKGRHLANKMQGYKAKMQHMAESIKEKLPGAREEVPAGSGMDMS